MMFHDRRALAARAAFRRYISPMSSQRRNMTVRIVPLRDEAAGDARVAGTPDERLALLSVLSHRMWALAGQAVPSYTRRTMPVKVSRLSDQ